MSSAEVRIGGGAALFECGMILLLFCLIVVEVVRKLINGVLPSSGMMS